MGADAGPLLFYGVVRQPHSHAMWSTHATLPGSLPSWASADEIQARVDQQNLLGELLAMGIVGGWVGDDCSRPYLAIAESRFNGDAFDFHSSMVPLKAQTIEIDHPKEGADGMTFTLVPPGIDNPNDAWNSRLEQAMHRCGIDPTTVCPADWYLNVEYWPIL